jgi:hypothetical protein
MQSPKRVAPRAVNRPEVCRASASPSDTSRVVYRLCQLLKWHWDDTWLAPESRVPLLYICLQDRRCFDKTPVHLTHPVPPSSTRTSSSIPSIPTPSIEKPFHTSHPSSTPDLPPRSGHEDLYSFPCTSNARRSRYCKELQGRS